MIKAYHQVGADGWTDEQLQAVLEAVLAQGKIEPASKRIDRGEMEIECFTGKDRDSTIEQSFDRADSTVLKALKAIAKEKIKKLPKKGLTQSLFNCVDLIAGDLDLVFLSPEDWYSVQNGFVFDAEELLMKGGRFRPRDLLGNYKDVIEQIISRAQWVWFPSVEEAKKDIEEALRDERETRERTGEDGIWDLRDCMEHSGDYSGEQRCQGEIVWPGTLPLDLAIEVWQNGQEITHLVQSA